MKLLSTRDLWRILKFIILSDQYPLSLPAAIPARACVDGPLRSYSLHGKRDGNKPQTILVT